MNIAAEINAVIRKLTSTGETHQVILERAYDTDAADLWDACTQPERLARWFEPVRGDLTSGGRYILATSGTEGDIQRCEPPEHLAVTWEYQGNISHVEIDLIPADAQTVLRLTHHCPPGDHWDTYGPAATGIGWEGALLALSLHLADAGASAEELSAAASADGGELTRWASEAWSRADKAAGTPSADAERRAASTAAFYLGETGEGEAGA